jgi:hypothetical protein
MFKKLDFYLMIIIEVLLIVVLSLLIFGFVVEAKELDSLYCYYPENLQIESSEFSTGGGDKAVILLEVSGYLRPTMKKKMSDKSSYEEAEYTTYIDSLSSVSGFLGLGRFTVPDRIIYIPWDKNYMILTKKVLE